MTQILVILAIVLVIGFILSFSKNNNGIQCPDCKSNMEFVEYIDNEKLDLYRCPKCGRVKRVSPL